LNRDFQGGCEYKEELNKYEKNPAMLRDKIQKEIKYLKEQDGAKEVFDMDDLKKALRNARVCPYFAATRELSKDADVIFCPFNYLICKSHFPYNYFNGVMAIGDFRSTHSGGHAGATGRCHCHPRRSPQHRRRVPGRCQLFH